MGVYHQLIVFLFLLTFKTGFSAEISVFVQTGDSVHLDIQTHELLDFDVLSWIDDKSENIVRYIHASKEVKPSPSYKDRVDFNDETFSLTLKNMQKTDSGLYTARTIGEKNKDIICRVSVIDAVEAPVLTVNSIWSSSDSCTVNFTCRAHDLMIHSSYQNNSCSPEEVTSHENYTLILYCSEESIICNHSNPVSSKKDRIEIKQICVDNKEDGTGDNKFKLEGSLLSWLPILIGVCVVILAIVIFLLRKCKKGAQETDNTVYAQVETQEMQNINSNCNTYDVPERVQDHTHEETRDNLPNTTYCTVGQHQKPADPPETERTIYSTVCKQPKPPAN